MGAVMRRALDNDGLVIACMTLLGVPLVLGGLLLLAKWAVSL